MSSITSQKHANETSVATTSLTPAAPQEAAPALDKSQLPELSSTHLKEVKADQLQQKQAEARETQDNYTLVRLGEIGVASTLLKATPNPELIRQQREQQIAMESTLTPSKKKPRGKSHVNDHFAIVLLQLGFEPSVVGKIADAIADATKNNAEGLSSHQIAERAATKLHKALLGESLDQLAAKTGSAKNGEPTLEDKIAATAKLLQPFIAAELAKQNEQKSTPGLTESTFTGFKSDSFAESTKVTTVSRSLARDDANADGFLGTKETDTEAAPVAEGELETNKSSEVSSLDIHVERFTQTLTDHDVEQGSAEQIAKAYRELCSTPKSSPLFRQKVETLTSALVSEFGASTINELSDSQGTDAKSDEEFDKEAIAAVLEIIDSSSLDEEAASFLNPTLLRGQIVVRLLEPLAAIEKSSARSRSVYYASAELPAQETASTTPDRATKLEPKDEVTLAVEALVSIADSEFKGAKDESAVLKLFTELKSKHGRETLQTALDVFQITYQHPFVWNLVLRLPEAVDKDAFVMKLNLSERQVENFKEHKANLAHKTLEGLVNGTDGGNLDKVSEGFQNARKKYGEDALAKALAYYEAANGQTFVDDVLNKGVRTEAERAAFLRTTLTASQFNDYQQRTATNAPKVASAVEELTAWANKPGPDPMAELQRLRKKHGEVVFREALYSVDKSGATPLLQTALSYIPDAEKRKQIATSPDFAKEFARIDSYRARKEEEARYKLRGWVRDPKADEYLKDPAVATTVQRFHEIAQRKNVTDSVDLIRLVREEAIKQGNVAAFDKALDVYKMVHGRPLLADLTNQCEQRQEKIDHVIKQFVELCIPKDQQAAYRAAFIDFKVKEVSAICAAIDAKKTEYEEQTKRDHEKRQSDSASVEADRIKALKRAFEILDKIDFGEGATGRRYDLNTFIEGYQDPSKRMYAWDVEKLLAERIVALKATLEKVEKEGDKKTEGDRKELRELIEKLEQIGKAATPVGGDEISRLDRELRSWRVLREQTLFAFERCYATDLVAARYLDRMPDGEPVVVDVVHDIAGDYRDHVFTPKGNAKFREVLDAAKIAFAADWKGISQTSDEASALAWAVTELRVQKHLLNGITGTHIGGQPGEDGEFGFMPKTLIAQHNARFPHATVSSEALDRLRRFQVDDVVYRMYRISRQQAAFYDYGAGKTEQDPKKMLEKLRHTHGAVVFDKAFEQFKKREDKPIAFSVYATPQGLRQLHRELASHKTDDGRINHLRQIRQTVGEANFVQLVTMYDKHLGAPLAFHLLLWGGPSTADQKTCLAKIFADDAKLFDKTQRERFITYAKAEQALALATVVLEKERGNNAVDVANATLIKGREDIVKLVRSWSETEKDPATKAYLVERCKKITEKVVTDAEVDTILEEIILKKFPELATATPNPGVALTKLTMYMRYLEVVGGSKEGVQDLVDVHVLLKKSDFDVPAARIYSEYSTVAGEMDRANCARLTALLRGRITAQSKLETVKKLKEKDQNEEIALLEKRFSDIFDPIFLAEYPADRFVEARRNAESYLRLLDATIEAKSKQGDTNSAPQKEDLDQRFRTRSIDELRALRDSIDWRSMQISIQTHLTNSTENFDRVKELVSQFENVYAGSVPRGKEYVARAAALANAFSSIDTYYFSFEKIKDARLAALEKKAERVKIDREDRVERVKKQQEVVDSYNVFTRNELTNWSTDEFELRHLKSQVEYDKKHPLLWTHESDSFVYAQKSFPAVRHTLYMTAISDRTVGYVGAHDLLPASTMHQSIANGLGIRNDIEPYAKVQPDNIIPFNHIVGPGPSIYNAQSALKSFEIGVANDFTDRSNSVGTVKELSQAAQKATGCKTQQDLIDKIARILVDDPTQKPSEATFKKLRDAVSVSPESFIGKQLSAIDPKLPVADQYSELRARLHGKPEELQKISAFLRFHDRPELLKLSETIPGLAGSDPQKNWTIIDRSDPKLIKELLATLPAFHKISDIEKLFTEIPQEELTIILDAFSAQNGNFTLGAHLVGLRPVNDAESKYLLLLASSRLVANSDITTFYDGPVALDRTKRVEQLKTLLEADSKTQAKPLEKVDAWCDQNFKEYSALTAALQLAKTERRTEDAKVISEKLAVLTAQLNSTIDQGLKENGRTLSQSNRLGIREKLVQEFRGQVNLLATDMLSHTGVYGIEAYKLATKMEAGPGKLQSIIDTFQQRNYSEAERLLINQLYGQFIRRPHVSASKVQLTGDIALDLRKILPERDPRLGPVERMLRSGANAALEFNRELLLHAIEVGDEVSALAAMIQLHASGHMDNFGEWLSQQSEKVQTAFSVVLKDPRWKDVATYLHYSTGGALSGVLATATFAKDTAVLAKDASVIAAIELKNRAFQLKDDTELLTSTMIGLVKDSSKETLQAVLLAYKARYNIDLGAELSGITSAVKGFPSAAWDSLLSSDLAKRVEFTTAISKYALGIGLEGTKQLVDASTQAIGAGLSAVGINYELLHSACDLLRDGTDSLGKAYDEVNKSVRDFLNSGDGPRPLLEYARSRSKDFGDTDYEVISKIFGKDPVNIADIQKYTLTKEAYVLLIAGIEEKRRDRNHTHNEAVNFHITLSNTRSRAQKDLDDCGPISTGRHLYAKQLADHQEMYVDQVDLLKHQRHGLLDYDVVRELVRLRGVEHLKDLAKSNESALEVTQSQGTISDLNTRDKKVEWVKHRYAAYTKWVRESTYNKIKIENHEWNVDCYYFLTKAVVITAVAAIPVAGPGIAFALACAWNVADKAYKVAFNGVSLADATKQFAIEFALDVAFWQLTKAAKVSFIRAEAKTGEIGGKSVTVVKWGKGSTAGGKGALKGTTVHSAKELEMTGGKLVDGKLVGGKIIHPKANADILDVASDAARTAINESKDLARDLAKKAADASVAASEKTAAESGKDAVTVTVTAAEKQAGKGVAETFEKEAAGAVAKSGTAVESASKEAVKDAAGAADDLTRSATKAVDSAPTPASTADDVTRSVTKPGQPKAGEAPGESAASSAADDAARAAKGKDAGLDKSAPAGERPVAKTTAEEPKPPVESGKPTSQPGKTAAQGERAVEKAAEGTKPPVEASKPTPTTPAKEPLPHGPAPKPRVDITPEAAKDFVKEVSDGARWLTVKIREFRASFQGLAQAGPNLTKDDKKDDPKKDDPKKRDGEEPGVGAKNAPPNPPVPPVSPVPPTPPKPAPTVPPQPPANPPGVPPTPPPGRPGQPPPKAPPGGPGAAQNPNLPPKSPAPGSPGGGQSGGGATGAGTQGQGPTGGQGGGGQQNQGQQQQQQGPSGGQQPPPQQNGPGGPGGPAIPTPPQVPLPPVPAPPPPGPAPFVGPPAPGPGPGPNGPGVPPAPIPGVPPQQPGQPANPIVPGPNGQGGAATPGVNGVNVPEKPKDPPLPPPYYPPPGQPPTPPPPGYPPYTPSDKPPPPGIEMPRFRPKVEESEPFKPLPQPWGTSSQTPKWNPLQQPVANRREIGQMHGSFIGSLLSSKNATAEKNATAMERSVFLVSSNANGQANASANAMPSANGSAVATANRTAQPSSYAASFSQSAVNSFAYTSALGSIVPGVTASYASVAQQNAVATTQQTAQASRRIASTWMQNAIAARERRVDLVSSEKAKQKEAALEAQKQGVRAQEAAVTAEAAKADRIRKAADPKFAMSSQVGQTLGTQEAAGAKSNTTSTVEAQALHAKQTSAQTQETHERMVAKTAARTELSRIETTQQHEHAQTQRMTAATLERAAQETDVRKVAGNQSTISNSLAEPVPSQTAAETRGALANSSMSSSSGSTSMDNRFTNGSQDQNLDRTASSSLYPKAWLDSLPSDSSVVFTADEDILKHESQLFGLSENAKSRISKKAALARHKAHQKRMREIIMAQLLGQQQPQGMRERLLKALIELGISEVEYRNLVTQIGQPEAEQIIEEVAEAPIAWTVDGKQEAFSSSDSSSGTKRSNESSSDTKRPNRTRAELYRKLKERDSSKVFTKREKKKPQQMH